MTNRNSDTVSVINILRNIVTDTIHVGNNPYAIAVNPNTHKAYVVNQGSNTVTVINGKTDSVKTTISLDGTPSHIAINNITNMIYITTLRSDIFASIDNSLKSLPIRDVCNNAISVIDGTKDTITNVVQCGVRLSDITINPNTKQLYMTVPGSHSITIMMQQQIAT